ncbi:MAG: hypothetical protein ACFB0B_13905 [Thermonemataceae bacterium]
MFLKNQIGIRAGKAEGFLAIMLLLLNLSTAYAQRQIDPVEITEKEKETLLVELSGLTNDQKSELDKIYDKVAKDLENVMNSSSDRSKKRSELQKVEEEKESVLKETLTSEQYAEYEKIKEKRKSEMRSRRRR